MLKAGIVGLPNVGKSTLYNAITRTRKAAVENYPFCTIDPNVGVVQVPDNRLNELATIVKTAAVVPAAIEIADIAGLVAGASKGEGLGNKFLANIREVDAIIHVVRCFEDDNVVHNMGAIDPIRDIETIATELNLADLQSIDNQLNKNQKKAKGGDKVAIASVALLERLKAHLNENQPANTLHLEEGEDALLSQFFLLSAKPVLYACNVDEADIADPTDNPYAERVRQFASKNHDAESCVLSAKMEAELSELTPEEAREYLVEMGVEDSGVNLLIQQTYKLLELVSFFTTNEKEAHAWNFREGMKAPQCAGIVHTDFEKGFIKAEVVSFDDLRVAGSIAATRDSGKYRLEGKDYAIKDGDIVLFRFNQ